MLIDFSVDNFTSIKNNMTLSSETGERLSKYKETNTVTENGISLLKNLLVFGPNGSGKSNLLDGIHLMKEMVLNDTSKITDVFDYRPFLLSNSTENNGVKFDIRFNYNQRTFDYGFSFTKNRITSEKLMVVTGNKEKIYFERVNDNYLTLPKNLKKVSSETRQNSLLLYNAQKMNDKNATDVLKWFDEDLIFVNDVEIPDALIDLIKDEDIKNEFLNFLRFADFNIIDINVREVSVPTFPSQIRLMLGMKEMSTTKQQLFAVHKVYDSDGNVIGSKEIQLSMESRGTQKIFLIALSIINAQLSGNGKTLLFDEFDDSLHFELSSALIEIFNSKQNLNQFILTTHELQLLDSKLRVDQIYLMEKDFQGISELKSIFDFSDSRNSGRRDISFMRRYMEGRFGAMPQIDVQEMLTALNNSDLERGN